MDMKVMIPTPPVDFNFDSACTTPYISAPSSPQRFGTFFYSAPTSPARVSAIYNEFSTAAAGGSSLSAVPFDWEEKPGTPKTKETSLHNDGCDDVDADFAFDFSGQLESSSCSFSAADELFDGGKIKPLKPPPRLQYDTRPPESPKSPRSPRQIVKEAFSPRHKKKDFDPFAAAIEQTRMENTTKITTTIQERPSGHQRGRERTYNSSNASSSRHKGTRSLSPFRVSDLLFERENSQENSKDSSNASSSSPLASFWYGKWKLKDLFLFRSASEGRATSKENLKKYAMLKKSHQDDVKNSSFRSTDSVGSVSSRRRGPVSAHELHYTVNRAVSEEMRKKTVLPYRHGLLGCLGFNQTLHDISSRGIGSMSRG